MTPPTANVSTTELSAPSIHPSVTPFPPPHFPTKSNFSTSPPHLRNASPPAKTIAVFGAGIAGLTAAHELTRLGYHVAVYEALPDAGGFFRSARLRENGNAPSEYSWHGMGPWYHNVFDLLRQIPFDAQGTVYDRALSRPIDFGIFPDRRPAQFYDKGPRSIPAMFAMTHWDFLKWLWLMLKTWASHQRTESHYATLNAADAWSRLLSPTSALTWRSCFGPWIGSDWTRCSLHTAGQFFRKQLISQPTHHHRADEDGPAWSQGAGDGWLLLRGPSSEFWFNHWVRHLSARGVKFFWEAPLEKLHCEHNAIVAAEVKGQPLVRADAYVLATDPFSAAQVVARSPTLHHERELRRFQPLIQDGPHTQVSFRVAFGEPIRFPRERTAAVLADTAFNLTLFAQEQAWRPEVYLGDGVHSLWTGTSCVGSVPGPIHGKPVNHCTKEEFIDEVREQILNCGALDALVREANGGRGLRSFPILRIEVWHEWTFSPQKGITPEHPKWVTSTHTQAHLPSQATTLPNLFLAGAHTRTQADVWSIEGAVESGRRAAKAIDPRVPVINQYKPAWLRLLSRLDDACYRMRTPHVLDLAAAALALTAVALVARRFSRPSPRPACNSLAPRQAPRARAHASVFNF